MSKTTIIRDPCSSFGGRDLALARGGADHKGGVRARAASAPVLGGLGDLRQGPLRPGSSREYAARLRRESTATDRTMPLPILYSLSAWRAISGPRSGLGRTASGQRQERLRRAWDAWREARRGGTSSECRCASARGGRDPVRRLSSLHRHNNASGGSIIRSARASPHGRWRCHSIAGRRGAGPRALDGEVASRLTRDLFRQRRLGRGPGLTPAPLRKFLILQTVRDGRYDVQSPLLVLCGPQKSPLNHSMRLSRLLARPGPRGRWPAQSLSGASAPSQIVFDFI